jgi:hypothetical protein
MGLLEEKWGVSAAAAVAVAAGPAAGAGAAAVEEQTEFTVLGLVLGRAFLDGLGRALDEVLGFLEAEAGDRADLLDSSRARPSPSRKARPRTRPRSSRPSSRRPAPRSSSSNPSIFLDGLGRALDEVLGFLEAEAGDRADLLDDLDLLVAGRSEHDRELGG